MLLRYLGAGALALAFLIAPAYGAGIPLVTGKCGCRIGWGVFIADCGSSRVTCTKAMCAAACQAAMPKKTGTLELTDVSAARRVHRGRAPDRVVGIHPQRRGGHPSRVASRPRSPERVGTAGPSQIDRDGRGYASAEARLSAPVRVVTHRRALGMAHRAIQGAAVGGQVAVEHSRPAGCYGIPWCGCWLRTVLGIPDRTLNLAIAWARVGSPATPDSANVVVWRHHVGKLLAHEGGRILVQSGNDRGAVRTRWLSPHVLGGVVAYRKV